MAALNTEDGEVLSEINVTPFVDVVLVLLIILMVTSTHLVKAALQVDLPRAATGGEAVSSTLNVVIEQDGGIFLDGERVDENALAQATRDARRHNKDVRAVVSAHRNVAYRSVVRTIDVVKGNGVTRFALDVEVGSDVQSSPALPPSWGSRGGTL